MQNCTMTLFSDTSIIVLKLEIFNLYCKGTLCLLKGEKIVKVRSEATTDAAINKLMLECMEPCGVCKSRLVTQHVTSECPKDSYCNGKTTLR